MGLARGLKRRSWGTAWLQFPKSIGVVMVQCDVQCGWPVFGFYLAAALPLPRAMAGAPWRGALLDGSRSSTIRAYQESADADLIAPSPAPPSAPSDALRERRRQCRFGQSSRHAVGGLLRLGRGADGALVPADGRAAPTRIHSLRICTLTLPTPRPAPPAAPLVPVRPPGERRAVVRRPYQIPQERLEPPDVLDLDEPALVEVHEEPLEG